MVALGSLALDLNVLGGLVGLERLEDLDDGDHLVDLHLDGGDTRFLGSGRLLLSELATTGRNGENSGSHLERPKLVDLDLKDVEKDENSPGDEENDNSKAPSDTRAVETIVAGVVASGGARGVGRVGINRTGIEETVDSDEEGKDLSANDGQGEDPGWAVGPEIALETRAEDHEVGARANLEVDDVLNLGTAEMEDVTGNEVVGKRGGGQEAAKDDGEGEELSEAPLVGSLVDGGVVDGDNQGGGVVEEGDHDDENGRERELKNGDGEEEVNEEVNGRGDTVEDVGTHALEDLARGLDGVDNGRETFGEQDNVSGQTGSVGATVDGNTDRGLLESGGVVDTITGHSNEGTLGLHELNHTELVLGNDLSEAIGAVAAAGELLLRNALLVQLVGGQNDAAHAQAGGDLLGNDVLVTSNHLDSNTEAGALTNGVTRVGARGIEESQKTEELPGLGVVVGAADAKAAVSVGGIFKNGVRGLFASTTHANDNVGRALADLEDGTVGLAPDSGLDNLADRVEGLKGGNGVLGNPGIVDVSAEVVSSNLDGLLADGKFDGIVGTRLGGEEGGDEEFPVGLAFVEVGIGHGELVEGEGAGLVGAEHGDTSKLFNGGKTLDDDLLLGQLLGADSHGDRKHSGKTDGDSGDNEDQNLLESGTDRHLLHSDENADEDSGEDDGDDDEEVADNVDDLLEVTLLVGDGDKVGSTTDEGVGAGLADDTNLLADLDDGGRVDDLELVLGAGERLTGQGRLINLELEGGFTSGTNTEKTVGEGRKEGRKVMRREREGKKKKRKRKEKEKKKKKRKKKRKKFLPAVSGNNVTKTKDDNVTGNELARGDLNQLTVAEDLGLEGEGVLEGVKGGLSLGLLNKADEGVDEQKGQNDTKVDLTDGFQAQRLGGGREREREREREMARKLTQS